MWTGKDDKILRQLEVEFSSSSPKELRHAGPGRRAAGPSTSRSRSPTLNKDQEIKAPKNARPLSELQSQLGVGALGLGEGLGGSSSGRTARRAAVLGRRLVRRRLLRRAVVRVVGRRHRSRHRRGPERQTPSAPSAISSV